MRSRKGEYEKLMETARGRASMENPLGRFFGKAMREVAKAMLSNMTWDEVRAIAEDPTGHSAQEVIVAQKLVFDRENPRFLDVNAYMKLLGEDKIQIEVSARDEASAFFSAAALTASDPNVITEEEALELSRKGSA